MAKNIIKVRVLGKKRKIDLGETLGALSIGMIANTLGHVVTGVFTLVNRKDKENEKKFNEEVMAAIKNKITSGEITDEEVGFILMEHMKETAENKPHKEEENINEYVEALVGKALATAKNSKKYAAATKEK